MVLLHFDSVDFPLWKSGLFHLPDSSPWPGEGLTFVVAPSHDESPPNSYGGYLGLTNATLEANPTPARNRFVAVEFDTTKQDYDPSDNHVGLNVGSVVSVKTADLTAFRIATNSSNPTNYTAWVEYDGAARHVSVYMGVRGEPKPASPVLDSPLDLSEHVPEKAYIGTPLRLATRGRATSSGPDRATAAARHPDRRPQR